MNPVRRRLCAGMAALLLASTRSYPQPSGGKRVVVIDDPDEATWNIRKAAMAQLATKGLKEGRDFNYERLELSGSGRAIDEMARSVAASRPDIIVVGSIAHIPAFRRHAGEIPVVSCNLADPVRTELMSQEVELLLEMLPRAQRLAFVSPAGADYDLAMEVLADAVKRRSVSVVGIVAASDAPSETIMASVHAARANLVVMGFARGKADLFELFTRAGVGSSVVGEDVNLGGLLALRDRAEDRLAPCIDVVARVVRGERPRAALDAEPRFHLTVNARTARRLGTSVPASVRTRADRIVD